MPIETVPVLPQPEPGLTPETLIARAAALRPLLREQQEESDARGRYSDEVHEALRRGGFYRILQPRMFGGYEFDIPTFYRMGLELARGCPSTAWNVGNLGCHHWLLAYYEPETQHEVWEADPDVLFRSHHRLAHQWDRRAAV